MGLGYDCAVNGRLSRSPVLGTPKYQESCFSSDTMTEHNGHTSHIELRFKGSCDDIDYLGQSSKQIFKTPEAVPLLSWELGSRAL